MAGALRTIVVLCVLAAVLAVGVGRLPQAARSDEPITVQTHAEVVGGSPQVIIDIKPGCKCNLIILHRCCCFSTIPVAIITTPEFDAATVDPSTVVFADAYPKSWKLVDVDRDRDKDLLLTFRIKDTNLAPGDTEACLDGKTYGGVAFHACDSVHVIGLDRWWKKMTAAAASIIAVDGGAGGNVSGDTGQTAALGASSAPVALPAAGSSGFSFWGDGWPWWAGLLAGAALAAFVMAAGAWALAAKRRNGSA
ncbi:MAG: hypothetical protein MUP14_00095 [Dehalococcoidia bacterium]|nr:hypothetical protein [Dehalococcoidia bacterium]